MIVTSLNTEHDHKSIQFITNLWWPVDSTAALPKKVYCSRVSSLKMVPPVFCLSGPTQSLAPRCAKSLSLVAMKGKKKNRRILPDPQIAWPRKPIPQPPRQWNQPPRPSCSRLTPADAKGNQKQAKIRATSPAAIKVLATKVPQPQGLYMTEWPSLALKVFRSQSENADSR